LKKFKNKRIESIELQNIDRNIAIAFGLMVLGLMIIVLAVSILLYSKVYKDNDKQLQAIITEVLGNSINRISFSGKYHAQLLVDQITESQPRIERVLIIGKDGKTVANSDSKHRNPVHMDILLQQIHEVADTDSSIFQLKKIDNTTVQRIIMPYRSGFQNSITGAIIVDMNIAEVDRALYSTLSFMAVLIIILLCISFIFTYYLSKYLGKPVRILALQLKGILDYSPSLIQISSKNGEINEWSATAKDFLEEYPKFLQDITQKVFAENRQIQKESFYKKGDQTYHFLSTAFPVITNTSKRVVQACTISIDITSKKISEEALRQSEERFRALVETTSDWIWEVDCRGKYIYSSPKIKDFLGYEPEEILGKTPFDLMPEEERIKIKQNFSSLLKTGSPITGMQNIALHKNGNRVIFETSGVPVFNHNGTLIGYRGIDRDVTEQVAREATLRHQQKLESIGTLAGGVAHEINNPINIIMNYGQLIIEKAEENSRISEDANEIVHESMRIAEIVRNLLSFSRHEQEQHSYANIADIINSTLTLTNKILSKDQISFTTDIEESLPPIKCRSQQLMQVVMNLITNARDALNEKYPGYHKNKTILVTSKLMGPDEDQWIRTTIEDHGSGIPDNIRDRIFDPFYTSKPRDRGTGLGLSVSYGIIKEHKGHLEFESVKGEYTRFHMDIPVDNGWELNRQYDDFLY